MHRPRAEKESCLNYVPLFAQHYTSEAGRQRRNRQLYRSSKHHSPAPNPLGGRETAGCGRRRPAQPASIRDVRDITEAAPLARHGTTTSVAPQTTLARFFLIPGELSGSADHFCRAEAGSFSRALQVVVGFSDRSTDAHVTSGSWRSLRNPRRAAMNYAVLRLRQHLKINRRGRSLFLETLQVFRSCWQHDRFRLRSDARDRVHSRYS